MVSTPTLRDLLKAGVHFGHKTARWNPNMAKFIFTAKSGVHVINLEETEKQMKAAGEYLAKAAAAGQTVVFVGTKKQAAEIVKKAALDCGMPFVNSRWIGGTLTNFSVIKSSIEKFKTEKSQLEAGGEGLSKRDIAKLKENVEKNEKIYGGLVNVTKQPDVLLLIGAHDEKNALREARAAKVPVAAIVDTNANPKLVDFPVPANDDATKSIELFANYFSAVIKASKTLAAKKNEEAK